MTNQPEMAENSRPCEIIKTGTRDQLVFSDWRVV